MPSAAVQPEKAPQQEVTLNPSAVEYVKKYYSEESYTPVLTEEIKKEYPQLKPEMANEVAEKLAFNIHWGTDDIVGNNMKAEKLPVHRYHSLLYKTLEQMFNSEVEVIANWLPANMQKKDLDDKMVDREYLFEAAFNRFFNPLIHYNELESRLHDNNVRKMELSRENQKLPVKNLDRRDQKRKQEINYELIKLARERKRLEAMKKDAEMLANFVPGYEMNKQEAKKKTEAAGWAFEEDKFVAGWLEKNAVEKAAQLKKKLIEAPKKRKEQFEKRWEKTHPQSAQEKKES